MTAYAELVTDVALRQKFMKIIVDEFERTRCMLAELFDGRMEQRRPRMGKTLAIRDETGIATQLSTTGGTSDGRFIAQICPQVVELGPPNGTIHKINEHVALADIEPLKNIYRRVLERLHALALA